MRVDRGGSWLYPAWLLRPATRERNPPDFRDVSPPTTNTIAAKVVALRKHDASTELKLEANRSRQHDPRILRARAPWTIHK